MTKTLKLSALDIKLTKWLGWESDGFNYWYEYNKDNYKKRRPIPYFTQSLDLCFKWLEPKFPLLELHNCQAGFRAEVSLDMKKHYESFNKNPALALCKAIEQLIDKEQL